MEQTTEQRKAILDREVRRYVQKGYLIESRTDTTAQLRKPKAWSKLGCILGGFILYWVIFQFKKEIVVYLEVEPSGKVRTTRRKISVSR